MELQLLFHFFFPLYVNSPLHTHLQSLKGKGVEKKSENVFFLDL